MTLLATIIGNDGEQLHIHWDDCRIMVTDPRADHLAQPDPESPVLESETDARAYVALTWPADSDWAMRWADDCDARELLDGCVDRLLY